MPSRSSADASGRLWRASREQLAAATQVPRDVVWYAVATMICSTVWLWPHLVRFGDVPDRGDPAFSAWRIARIGHQLAADPARLFDGNIFHPLPLTLTYSDPTLLQSILGSPLVLAGVEPMTAANLLFFLAFPACGLAFFAAAWRLTLDPRAATVAGVAGAWHPFHSEHYSHLELQWFVFVPLAIVALLLTVARPSTRRGLALGAAVALQWLASMYLGLALAALMLPCALAALLAWRIRPTLALVRALAIAALVAGTASLATALPYLSARDARGERTPSEVALGSATLSDYARTHRRLASYGWHSRAANVPERELFQGGSILALAGIGIWPPVGAAHAAIAAAGMVALDWSLGVNGVSYGWLYDRLAPFRGIRVPARFSVMFGSTLILLGAYGARRTISLARSPRQQIAVCAVLTAAVLLDLRVSTVLVRYWADAPSIYSRVTSDMVLAELPAGHDIDYMYFSTSHWARLLGGYSGYIPRDGALSSAVERFPDPAAIDALRDRGATHLTYNCAFERSVERCQHTLRMLDTNPRVQLVASGRWYEAEVRLYRMEN